MKIYYNLDSQKESISSKLESLQRTVNIAAYKAKCIRTPSDGIGFSDINNIANSLSNIASSLNDYNRKIELLNKRMQTIAEESLTRINNISNIEIPKKN